MFVILLQDSYLDKKYNVIYIDFKNKYEYVFKDLIFKNASIGKKIMNLQVVTKDNNKPNVIALILRNIFICYIYPISFILILIFNKSLGDFVFKTKVVEVKK